MRRSTSRVPTTPPMAPWPPWTAAPTATATAPTAAVGTAAWIRIRTSLDGMAAAPLSGGKAFRRWHPGRAGRQGRPRRQQHRRQRWARQPGSGSGRRWTAWRQLRFQGARGVVMYERSPPDRMEIPRAERAVALRPGGSVRGLVNAITNYLMQSLPDERARRHTHGPTSRVPARLPPICLLLRGFA